MLDRFNVSMYGTGQGRQIELSRREEELGQTGRGQAGRTRHGRHAGRTGTRGQAGGTGRSGMAGRTGWTNVC